MKLGKILSEAVKKAAPKVKTFASDNSSPILIGVGIAASVAAIIFTAKAEKNAVKAVENENENRRRSHQPMVTKKEAIKLTWKYYIPAAICEGISIGSGIAEAVTTKKKIKGLQTAIASGAALTASLKDELKEYKSQVKDAVGEKQEAEIQRRTDNKLYSPESVNPNDPKIPMFGQGTDLFFDPVLGRYFRCDVPLFRSVQEELDMRLEKYDDFIQIDDLYATLAKYISGGTEFPGSRLGTYYGWRSMGNEKPSNIKLNMSQYDELHHYYILEYYPEPDYEMNHLR